MDVRAFFGGKKKATKVKRVIRVPISKLQEPKAGTKAGVKAIVKKMLDRKVQDKRVGFQVENRVFHNSAISAADCRPLIDQIIPIDSALGNVDQQRNGDKIALKYMRVKGILALSPTAQTSTQTLYVRVLLLAQKDIKVGAQVVAGTVDTAYLLSPDYNTGLGADQIAFSGNTENIYTPINTDKFRVYYDRVFKLCPATNATVQNEMNAVRWSYTFKKSKLPVNLTYDAGNGDWANNFAPFLAIGYAYADGIAPDTVTTKIVSHCDSQLVFEDA